MPELVVLTVTSYSVTTEKSRCAENVRRSYLHGNMEIVVFSFLRYEANIFPDNTVPLWGRLCHFNYLQNSFEIYSDKTTSTPHRSAVWSHRLVLLIVLIKFSPKSSVWSASLAEFVAIGYVWLRQTLCFIMSLVINIIIIYVKEETPALILVCVCHVFSLSSLLDLGPWQVNSHVTICFVLLFSEGSDFLRWMS